MTQELSLARLLGPDHQLLDLQGTTTERVLSEMLEQLVTAGEIPSSAVNSIRRSILAREREATTGIGNGLAIPHMKDCPHVTEVRAVFGRSKEGVDYGSTDGAPVHVLFLLLTPSGHESEHIQLMRRIVFLSRDRNTMQHIITTDVLKNLQVIFEDADSAVS